MIPLTIILDGENAWPDLRDKPIHHVTTGLAVAALAGGMTSKLPSVAIRVNLPNGEVVIAETSARLFCAAADAFRARYPEIAGEEPVVQ